MSQFIKSDILNEEYQKIVLDNGLTVMCYPMEGYNAVHAVFATNFGSIDRKFKLNGKEIEVPAGVAHFLEHKMFENEDGDAFDKYAKTGASANAFTSFDKTCYIFTATDKVSESLDILLSFVTQPYFTPKTVEKEQGIIAQEIKMYDDNANWRLLFGVLEGLYKTHTIKDDIAGSVESISHITDTMLYDCAKAFYSPSEMVLSLAGNINMQTILDACERAGFKKETIDVEKIEIVEEEGINYKEKSINMPVSMPMVALGYKEKVDTKDKLKQEITAGIIVDIISGANSELFNKLYDLNIVNGTFDGEVLASGSAFSIIFSGETNHPEVLITELKQAIAKLKQTGIQEDDFITTKNSTYGGMIEEFENVEEVATNIVTAYFGDYNVYSPLEVLYNLTLEEANEQLKTMFNEDLTTIFKVMPVEGL